MPGAGGDLAAAAQDPGGGSPTAPAHCSKTLKDSGVTLLAKGFIRLLG